MEQESAWKMRTPLRRQIPAAFLFTALLAANLAAQSDKHTPEEVNINTLVAERDTEYHDSEFGVSFRLPPSWIPLRAVRWWDPGWEGTRTAERATTVTLRHQESNDVVRVYYRLNNNTTATNPEEVRKVLLASIDDKISQRRRQEQFSDYIMRKGSCESREIAGQSAITWVGEYTQNGKKMAEYLVWIQNQKSLVEFFAQVPAEELDRVRQEVEPLVESIRLP
jgi:hypothetical protein